MSKFGSPNHDSIWFEDKSLSHPNGAHFDNFRNEIKTWRENVLSNGIYPCFTSWALGLRTDSEDDMDSIIQVSDTESEAEVTSSSDDKVDDSDIASNVQNYYISNKRRLETLWKLYRNIGESVEDMAIRLSHSQSINKSVTCSESNSNNQEDLFNNKNDSNIVLLRGKSCTNSSTVDAEEQPDIKPDIRQSSDIHDDIDTKDWPFKSSIWYNSRNSESLVDPTPNCKYDVPRLKQITNEELILKNKPTSRKNRTSIVGVKKEAPSRVGSKKTGGPIIVHMYGVQTINYNDSPPKVKIADCFKTSRLSDSSYDEEIELIEKRDFAGSRDDVVNEKSSSILKNRFRNNKRKRTDNNDGFLHAFTVSLSSDSDVTEASNMKKKKVKNCCEETTNDFNDCVSQDDIDEQLDVDNACFINSSSSSYTCTRSSCSYSSESSSEVEH